MAAADAGLIGTRLWRGIAYQNGAFWAGLLSNWRPNYPLQPGMMFITYAFLHGGFWHLAGNMASLIFLNGALSGRLGQGALVLVYLASALGGALLFGLLTQSPAPMVGASGALFGLAGAWQYWERHDLVRLGRRGWPVWRTLLGLIFLNLLMWWLQDGSLAWEAHLGGFASGWVFAYFWENRSRRWN